MISPQAIAGVGGLVLLLAAGAYRGLSQSSPDELDAPSIDAPAVEYLTAATPVIPPFETFYTNNLNPFQPAERRKDEQKAIEHPVQPLPPGPAEPAPAPPPPPRPPLVLPRITSAKDAVPDCVGLVAHKSGRKALLVRLAPDQPPMTVVVGDEQQGWRLDAIDGTTARWTAPTGEQRAFVIAPDARNGGVTSGGHSGVLEVKAPEGAPSGEVRPRGQPQQQPSGGGPMVQNGPRGKGHGKGRDPGVTDDGSPMPAPRPVLPPK